MTDLDIINNSIEFKPYKLVPYQEKSSLVGKHVQWLKQERHALIERIAIVALVTLEVLALACSVVGLVIIYKGIQESKRIDAEKAFFKEAEQKQPPTCEEQIETKSKTRTFNHTHEFAIENGVIWSRQRKSQEAWKPVYFDGYSTGKIPVEISCDGTNLAVLDQDRNIHYKKVLREHRSEEIQRAHRVLGGHVDLEKDKYIAVDKSERNNWKDGWFSLPFVHHLVHLVSSKRLKLPEDIRAWGISHRGKYNDYLEDAKLQRHEATGVTTLYALLNNGKEIWKYDPWSPKFAKMSIMLPETSNTSFEAFNMSVSASAIMVIGYETEKTGQVVKKTLKIKTKLADIDSEGWNPSLKYDYFVNPNDKDVRVIPLPQWEDHPIELKEGASITDKITIVQTGAGNDARELFVEGADVDENGVAIKGYYYKALKSTEWKFKAHAIELSEPLEREIYSSEPFQTTVHDYQSSVVSLKTRLAETISAQLKNFGLHAYDSQLDVRIGNETFALQIHKKKTLKNFLGLDGESYDLIIPERYHDNELIKKIFNHQKVIPLNVQEKNQMLTIAGRRFEFTFRRI